ncbi:MAG: RNA-directed polymerase [Solirubrobacteraceae bacterium]|nr:RNA-directed polymerase [Solirubrobacteraceae bacterium]
MAAIEERIVDRKLLILVRGMLRAGVMEHGVVRRRDVGTPQGGVISPLLANVYLHRLDRRWQNVGDGVLVRYADDLVVMCKNRRQAIGALDALTAIRLHRLGRKAQSGADR